MSRLIVLDTATLLNIIMAHRELADRLLMIIYCLPPHAIKLIRASGGASHQPFGYHAIIAILHDTAV